MIDYGVIIIAVERIYFLVQVAPLGLEPKLIQQLSSVQSLLRSVLLITKSSDDVLSKASNENHDHFSIHFADDKLVRVYNCTSYGKHEH